jgi:cytochrome P450
MGMVAQTHPEYWEEAERFMPERWLDPVKAKEYAMAWFPFSAGFVFCSVFVCMSLSSRG